MSETSEIGSKVPDEVQTLASEPQATNPEVVGTESEVPSPHLVKQLQELMERLGVNPDQVAAALQHVRKQVGSGEVEAEAARDPRLELLESARASCDRLAQLHERQQEIWLGIRSFFSQEELRDYERYTNADWNSVRATIDTISPEMTEPEIRQHLKVCIRNQAWGDISRSYALDQMAQKIWPNYYPESTQERQDLEAFAEVTGQIALECNRLVASARLVPIVPKLLDARLGDIVPELAEHAQRQVEFSSCVSCDTRLLFMRSGRYESVVEKHVRSGYENLEKEKEQREEEIKELDAAIARQDGELRAVQLEQAKITRQLADIRQVGGDPLKAEGRANPIAQQFQELERGLKGLHAKRQALKSNLAELDGVKEFIKKRINDDLRTERKYPNEDDAQKEARITKRNRAFAAANQLAEIQEAGYIDLDALADSGKLDHSSARKARAAVYHPSAEHVLFQVVDHQ